jgi:hypothetical protein
MHPGPFRCREHPHRKPPIGVGVDKHNATVRAVEAQEARAGTVSERREWLRALTAMASHLAVDADVDHLSSATVDALLAGIDDGREWRAAEQTQAG